MELAGSSAVEVTMRAPSRSPHYMCAVHVRKAKKKYRAIGLPRWKSALATFTYVSREYVVWHPIFAVPLHAAVNANAGSPYLLGLLALQPRK